MRKNIWGRSILREMLCTSGGCEEKQLRTITLKLFKEVATKIICDLKKKKKKRNLSLCLINQAAHHDHFWGSGSIAPSFLT
jgi:hypothetical protein